ncbi:MAG: SDR family oxidoreductase [Chloroflexi bacterium]|nr:SDR family oxidoreductase [Chloroflexota bacterium]
MPNFSGKVAIVTGGAQGIGGATARRLARDGAAVLIVDINPDAAEANAMRIKSAGGTARVLKGDVAEEPVCRSMVETAIKNWGRVDILIQNAYGGGRDVGGSALDVSPDAWDRGMALLVKSLFIGAKYAVPEMEKAGGGSIVNISSVHGILMARGAMVYETGKMAVIGLTRQMAVDFGPKRIRVNAIAPGHIVTENMKKGWDTQGNAEGFRFFELQYPVRRTGVPDDIANAIAFLCSEDASFITGVLLPVDGGMSIQLQENILMDLVPYVREHPNLKFPYG